MAANGGVTVWLWIISVRLFFCPQAIAVIELSRRFPGGVYLWTKEAFGDFRDFLSGWCYWTNDVVYLTTVMLGRLVHALGSRHESLADNTTSALAASLVRSRSSPCSTSPASG